MLFIFLWICSYVGFALNPGIKLGLSQAFLNDAKNQILPALLNYASLNATISDLEIPIALIEGSLKLTNITINDLSINPYLTNFHNVARHTLYVNVINLEAELGARYVLSSNYLNENGEGIIQLDPTNIVLGLEFAEDGGLPSIKVSELRVNVNDIKINFQGGVIAKLLTATGNLLTGAIGLSIQNALVDLFQYESNVFLATAFKNPVIKLNDNLQLNYTLTADPVITRNWAQFDLYGNFSRPGNVSVEEYDFPEPVLMQNYRPLERELQLSLSEMPVNTLVDCLLYNTSIGTVLPGNTTLAGGLTLSYFVANILIPGIGQKYPGEQVDIGLEITKPPLVEFRKNDTFKDGDIILDLDAAINFLVDEGNTTALELDSTIQAAAQITTTSKGLGIELDELNITSIDVGYTNVTVGDLTQLLDGLDTLLNIGIPIINGLLSNFTFYNISRIGIADTDVEVNEGYLYIGITPTILTS